MPPAACASTNPIGLATTETDIGNSAIGTKKLETRTTIGGIAAETMWTNGIPLLPCHMPTRISRIVGAGVANLYAYGGRCSRLRRP